MLYNQIRLMTSITCLLLPQVFCQIMFFSCPITIAYSMGQIIKSICICQCVCVLHLCVRVSVCLRALSRSHFLTDFHQNWHRRKNPQKEEQVRWGQYRSTLPLFCPKTPILGQEVLKTNANFK